MNERTTLRSQTGPSHGFIPAPISLLQRKCACGGTPGLDGECAECRNRRLQREVSNQASTPPVPPAVHEVLRSSGQPLDTKTRVFMESRLGHDFSQVRIHTNEKAAESAQGVNALAYTVGRNVVFGTGQYAPSTDAGRRLLAHELTHVVQQGHSAVGRVTAVSQPSDPHEREAAVVAERFTRMPAAVSEEEDTGGPEPSALAGSASSAVQRQAAEGETEKVVADEEEGIEVDPNELMIMPRWSMVALPDDSGPTTASFAPTTSGTLQRQAPTATPCDAPTQMRKVISGTFEGGKTLDDYFPDLVGAGAWGSNNTAGPFDNGTRAGSSVQLIGELPIPCATSAAPTTLGQTVSIVRLRADGKKLKEGGKPLEGQTIDDIKRSKRDQSKAPFRQTWVGAVSMADPISGVSYSTLKSYEFEANLTTSLAGAGGTVSVDWGVTVEAAGGRVTKNEVR
ncbi:MAG TPA: DUF4157 domain-containing protein [Rubrobacteraceae bacterium]|nr:DUF4157 domain-containing protein [Rubrobacteraceae bacterium]